MSGKWDKNKWYCVYRWFIPNNISVKDKDNILSHNVWSATDYNNNINDFTPKSTITASSSSEWVVNGFHSLKIVSEQSSTIWQSIKIYVSDLNKDDEVNFKCKVLNKNDSFCQLTLSENVNGSYSHSETVNVPISEDTQEISISNYIISQEITNLIISSNMSIGEIFIDDLFLQKV